MLKTYIITGASQGIGREVALRLSKDAKVIAISRNLEKLKEIKADNISIYSVDLTEQGSIDLFISKINNQKIDGVLNNAGMLINKPFFELTDDDWFSSFNSNVMGAIRLIRSLKNQFSDSSHIVNVSSMSGYQGSSKFPGLSAYSSSKGALSIATESLSVELLEFGIKVNALCLGAVQTEMLSNAFPDYEAPVQPEQMADYISEFLQNGSTFFNGQVLPVALSNP